MTVAPRVKQAAWADMDQNSTLDLNDGPLVLPPLTLADWQKRDLPSPEYLLGSMLSTTNRMLISAKTGIGKTNFALAIGIRVAAGVGFLHWKEKGPRRVLYIDGEMSRRQLKLRLAAEVQRIEEAPIGFHALCAEDIEDFKPLNTPAGRATIWRIIEEVGGIDLVVFDNVMSLIAGSMIEEEPWAEVMPFVRSLTQRQIGQIWIHHTGHDEGRSYGTKTREWQLDTVAMLEEVRRPDTDVSFKVSFRKARERTPETRYDFQDVEVALVGDQWVFKPSDGAIRPVVAKKISPNAQKFLAALTNAIASDSVVALSGGRRAATVDVWKAECARAGLIDPEAKGANARSLISKYRRELVSADRVACEGDYTWLLT